MKNKLNTRLLGAIICMISLSFTSLVGCGSKELAKVEVEKKVESSGKYQINKDIKELENTKINIPNDSTKIIQNDNETVNVSEISNIKNNLIEYIGLLGLSKEKLISTLKENPSPVDEGGLEFKKAGIRVWFDSKNFAQVEQIFIIRKDINLNSAKIGDSISKFKEVFGNPISDKNGDAHFKYNGIFLSVNYDAKTGETFGVYILKHDF